MKWRWLMTLNFCTGVVIATAFSYRWIHAALSCGAYVIGALVYGWQDRRRRRRFECAEYSPQAISEALKDRGIP